MKLFTLPKIKTSKITLQTAYLFVGLLFLNGSLFSQIDLELSLTQNQNSPNIYTSYTVTASITNTGSQNATSVRVHVPRPNGVVYTGGSEYTSSQGIFRYAGNERWIVGSLGAGETETLTISYFLLQSTAPVVYAQVQNANQSDADSTPNNGTPPTPNEDDEAATNASGPPGGNNRPDLRLGSLSVVSSAQQGAVANYSFTLINSGNATASADYTIGAYLSIDNVLNSQDILVGVVNTGNTSVGQIQNVPGQITVPGNLAPGSYNLILKADKDNVITESNENNNTAVDQITITGGGTNPGGSCAFITNYNPPNFDALSGGVPITLTENSERYRIRYIRRTASDANTKRGTYNIDLEGNIINTFEQNYVTPEVGASVESSGEIVELVFTNGNRVNIPISNLPSNLGAIYVGSIKATSAGFAFIVTVIDGSNGNTSNRVFQTNSQGVVFRSDVLPIGDFYTGNVPIIEGSDGGIYTEWATGGDFSLGAVPANGGAAWSFRVAGDTPSTTWLETEVSEDGQFVYTLKTDNQRVFVSKLEAATGNSVGYDLTAFTAAADPTVFRQTFALGMYPTSDGGLLLGMRYREPGAFPTGFGIIYGKLGSNGQTLWKQEGPDEVRLTPIGETNDGGAMFIGIDDRSTTNRDDDETVIVKTTNTGQLTPLCSGSEPPAGGDIDLSLSVTSSNNSPSIWNNFSATFTVRNAGPQTATNVKVKIPLPTGIVYSGGNEFSASQGTYNPYGNRVWNVGSLANGASANISVNFFVTSNSSINLYGQVSDANQEDGDSTPDNGSCCSSNEDDEAALTLGSSSANNREISLEEFAQSKRKVLINKIFPNPSSVGVVEFEILSNEYRDSEIEVFNATGQKIDVSFLSLDQGINDIILDISNYKSGLYFVLIQDQNMKFMPTKFVVQNN